MCLGVACHLHFWQNDWGLLHATAVLRNAHQIRAHKINKGKIIRETETEKRLVRKLEVKIAQNF